MNPEKGDKLGRYLVDRVAEEFQGNRDSVLRKLITRNHVMTILKYIRDNKSVDSLITKEAIAKHMDQEQVCSRPTTLEILASLQASHIIENDKKRDNTFSRMIINPTFDFKALEVNLLTFHINQTQQLFTDFSEETKGANTILVKELLTALQNFSSSKEVYTPKQRRK